MKPTKFKFGLGKFKVSLGKQSCWPFARVDKWKNERENATMIYIHHKGLLHSHLPYIINHKEHLSCFMQLFNRMTAQVLAFPWPCDVEWTSRSFKLESNCSLDVSSIIASLKQIGSQVSWHKTMLVLYFTKLGLQSSLPRTILAQKKNGQLA